MVGSLLSVPFSSTYMKLLPFSLISKHPLTTTIHGFRSNELFDWNLLLMGTKFLTAYIGPLRFPLLVKPICPVRPWYDTFDKLLNKSFLSSLVILTYELGSPSCNALFSTNSLKACVNTPIQCHEHMLSARIVAASHIRSTISCELSCDSCKIAGVILIVFPESLSNANDQRPPQGTFNGESFLLGVIALEADVIIWKYHRGVRENPNTYL